MPIYYPQYYPQFRCIAADCPDACCQLWDVAVDEGSAAYYRGLPGALGDALRECLSDEDDGTYMTIQDGRCPMWRADGLCRIQAELGEGALCQTCREFPRLTHDYGDFVERGLELSCPEAARLILSAADAPLVCEEGETGKAEYDGEAMAVLLESRKTALEILSQPGKTGEILAKFYLYATEVQPALDGGELLPFDERAAMSAAEALAVESEPGALLPFFLHLEILTPEWHKQLKSPEFGDWPEETAALARYFVGRYWLQAVSDYDLYSRAKAAVVLCLLAKLLGGEAVTTAQRLSKELENSAENWDALLDAAYTEPAFADGRILGLLLEKGA